MHGSIGAAACGRLLRRWLLPVLLFPLALPLPAGAQQVRIPAEAMPTLGGLEAVLRRGAVLEQQRRWRDALSFYQEALKEHPGREELSRRLETARIHVDVARCYGDASYLEMLARLSEPQALAFYDEVLKTIEAHYVHSPDWARLAAQGERRLIAALDEPAFLRRHAPQAPPEQLEAFRTDLARAAVAAAVRTRYDALEAARRAGRLAERRGVAPASAILAEFACAAAGSLDPYSSFLTGQQLDEVFSQIEGNFIGLGVELKTDTTARALEIVDVIPGGPAEQAGVRPGDRITAVDGRPTAAMSLDAAADLLKGPEGSETVLTLARPDGAVRQLRLVRRRVDVPSVEDAAVVDAEYGVAYLRLTSFQKTTLRDLDAALWKLHADGMQRLIIDLRNNPGGLLTAAVEAADRFLGGGVIVSTRGRDAAEDFDYRAQAAGTWRVPLVVIIDGGTASASEIFAGAIRDSRRGLVVGQRSFGKGSVQGIFPLSTVQAGLRLTTAKFYSPSGRPISHWGVAPDIVVRSAAKPVASGPAAAADPALEAALQAARRQL